MLFHSQENIDLTSSAISDYCRLREVRTCAPPGGISKTPVFLCQLPVNWDVGSAGRILKRSGLENVALNVSDPEFPDALNSSLGFDCDVYRKHVSVLYCKLFFCFVL